MALWVGAHRPFAQVVCQYFLRGECKFGDRCRNEHPRTTGTQRTNSLFFEVTHHSSCSLLFRSDMVKSDHPNAIQVGLSQVSMIFVVQWRFMLNKH